MGNRSLAKSSSRSFVGKRRFSDTLAAMKKPAPDIDAYLAKVPQEQRAALQALRQVIRRAAPDAEECISYGLPGFRQGGRLLVSFGAARKHCAFYPGATVWQFKTELKGFSLSKGTIRFTPDHPIPARVVSHIVKARIADRLDRAE